MCPLALLHQPELYTLTSVCVHVRLRDHMRMQHCTSMRIFVGFIRRVDYTYS